jgi:hypothetical protein
LVIRIIYLYVERLFSFRSHNPQGLKIKRAFVGLLCCHLLLPHDSHILGHQLSIACKVLKILFLWLLMALWACIKWANKRATSYLTSKNCANDAKLACSMLVFSLASILHRYPVFSCLHIKIKQTFLKNSYVHSSCWWVIRVNRGRGAVLSGRERGELKDIVNANISLGISNQL